MTPYVAWKRKWTENKLVVAGYILQRSNLKKTLWWNPTILEVKLEKNELRNHEQKLSLHRDQKLSDWSLSTSMSSLCSKKRTSSICQSSLLSSIHLTKIFMFSCFSKVYPGPCVTSATWRWNFKQQKCKCTQIVIWVYPESISNTQCWLSLVDYGAHVGLFHAPLPQK